MSLHIEIAYSVPKETARIARAAFPKGNAYLTLRDQLGTLFEDAQFADLFPPQGQPAEAPWRLALVTVLQFAEGLSDRQAAECVRSRLDWKYALGLELTDEGFDYSVLCEFRARLLAKGAEQRLLETLLTLAQERGWLKARGKQRTDSTHVLACVRALNRVERVGETLRVALNTLAQTAPDWLAARVPDAWLDRYGKPFTSLRLPTGQAAREALALTIGEDGFALLHWLSQPQTPPHLARLPQLQTLRQVWVQNYAFVEGTLGWRPPQERPPAAQALHSPHDADARFSQKRDTVWVGYKAHLSETCDADAPHLVTQVQTTLATTQDSDTTEAIHADMNQTGRLPTQHFVDGGYLAAHLLVSSARDHAVDLYGPVPPDHSWQARAQEGFASADFAVDWEAQQVTCPRGKHSVMWKSAQDAGGTPRMDVRFAGADCAACPTRAQCTTSTQGRTLSLRPQEAHHALQAARQRQTTETFRKEYGLRAGIEGTLSQAVRVCGLRRSRYVGQAKTHLHNLLIATSLNLLRMLAWLMDVPLAKTRVSPFAALLHNRIPAAKAA